MTGEKAALFVLLASHQPSTYMHALLEGKQLILPKTNIKNNEKSERTSAVLNSVLNSRRCTIDRAVEIEVFSVSFRSLLVTFSRATIYCYCRYGPRPGHANSLRHGRRSTNSATGTIQRLHDHRPLMQLRTDNTVSITG